MLLLDVNVAGALDGRPRFVPFVGLPQVMLLLFYFRRVLTNRAKGRAKILQRFPVHLHFVDAGPAHGGEADNTQKIVAPRKMIAPALLAWMIQRNYGFCKGVIPRNFDELGPVAALTGKIQVIQRIIAAFVTRVNMFYAERLRCETGWAEAVFAETSGAFRNFPPFFDRDEFIQAL